MRRPPESAPGEFVDVGGHRLHVTCGGRGTPPVLLESGIAGSSLSWARVLPQVARFTRVCAYDRAGLGWSAPASTPRTFERICDDLHAVLAHIASGVPFVLVGHSFGSLVVRAYAARHPALVAGLVLVDPPTEWISAGPERKRMLRGARQLSKVGAFLARIGVVRVALALLAGGKPGAARGFVRPFGATATRTLERLVGEVRKLPPELHPMVQAIWCQPKCFHAMADYLLVLQQESALMAGTTPPSHIPVFVISGGHQTAEEIMTHRRLAEASPRGCHVIAEKSGHWIPFDQPEVIADAIRTLVEPSAARPQPETFRSSAGAD